MSDTKVIKGQAWIKVLTDDNKKEIKSSLVQEEITFYLDGRIETTTVTLIDDIWDDLTEEGGSYKSNAKKDYFYWEYQMTSIDDDATTVTIKYDCPRPKEGLFGMYVDEDGNYVPLIDPSEAKGDYAKYWVNKLQESTKNYEYKMAIQKKEIIFPETEYFDPNTGEQKTVDEIKVVNTDLGDITNLLNLF